MQTNPPIDEGFKLLQELEPALHKALQEQQAAITRLDKALVDEDARLHSDPARPSLQKLGNICEAQKNTIEELLRRGEDLENAALQVSLKVTLYVQHA